MNNDFVGHKKRKAPKGTSQSIDFSKSGIDDSNV